MRPSLVVVREDGLCRKRNRARYRARERARLKRSESP